MVTVSSNQASTDHQQLNALYQRIQVATSLAALMPEVESDLLAFLQAERITVYQWEPNGRGIASRYKSGDELVEIKVPLTTRSIAGFVALCQQVLRIADVYDEQELTALHPQLRFNPSYDKRTAFRSRSMIVIPIKPDDIVLGVLQVINAQQGGAFTEADQTRAEALATLLGHKFQDEFKSTQSPFDYLIQHHKITPLQLNAISQDAERRGRSIGSLLIADANVSQVDIAASLEAYYQVPFMGYQAGLQLPADLMREVVPQRLKQQVWVPVAGSVEEAVILIDNPSDHTRILEIQACLPNVKNFVLRVGLKEDIVRIIDNGLRTLADKVDLLTLINALPRKTSTPAFSQPAAGVDASVADPVLIQLMTGVITEACQLGASDIHLEPDGDAGVVRIRLDGICRRLIPLPSGYLSDLLAWLKMLSRLDLAETRKPQTGHIKLDIQGVAVEMRMTTLPVVQGEGAVLRLVASGGHALLLNQLNLSSAHLHALESTVSNSHGLFLVVGPTGSGKTTTVHALLGHINTPERTIFTAEDPIEITQPGIQQLRVAPKIGLTFATATRALLQADPDVVLIGEMHDQETAAIGIEAALTGQLVLSTLHTSSAPETITRLLNLGADSIGLSDALLGILAQRLIRTLCPVCKEPYIPDNKEFSQLVTAYGEEYLGELTVDLGQLQLYRAVGCEHCGGTGYRGRTGIYELLLCTESLSQMIYRRASLEELRQQAIEDGMRTLMQDGVRKVLNGQSDFMQLLKVVGLSVGS